MSKIYKVAVIGTRFAEDVHIPAFQRHPRFRVVTLAARDRQHTREVAHAFQIDRWYTDWREMIDQGGADLLSVVAPPHLHREMTLAGFDAGMHVLCEKPMALNAAEASGMLARAEESGLTGMIVHELRYLAGWARFGELLRDGHIGALRRLVFRFYAGGARADPSHSWSWWNDFHKGGGALGAFGCHYFDALQQWVRKPARVWGKLNAFIVERPLPGGQETRAVTADDSFLAVLDLGDGVEALFDFTSTAVPSMGSRITALGTAGTLIMEDARRLFGAQHGDELEPLDLSELSRSEGESWQLAPFLRLLDDLSAGLDGGFSPSPSFADGLAHQWFLDAVRISDALGAWVDYPPTGAAPKGTLPT